MRAAFAAVLLAAAGPASADDYSQVRQAWAEAREVAKEDPVAALPRFDALVAMSPANNGVLRGAIATAFEAHDTARLAHWLDRFARQGGVLSPAAQGAIREQLGESIAATLAAIERNRSPLNVGTIAFRIPPATRLIEGVAYDRRRGVTFVSSVVDRVILRVDAQGRRVAAVLAQGAGAPMALFADDRRDLLWAAVDGDPFAGKEPGSGGLLRLSLRTGSYRLIAGPGAPLHLGDVTVGPDGTAYGADAQSGALYRCRPGCDRLETLVAPGHLRSAQGMAVAPDGRTLWVSDYAYGLLGVDLRTGGMWRIGAAPGIALDGIDGMTLRRGRLVAVQNGPAPARLIQIALDSSGRAASSVRVLARGGTAADEPTQVALARGGAILVVANSQWSRYEKGASAGPQDETRIVRIAPENLFPDQPVKTQIRALAGRRYR